MPNALLYLPRTIASGHKVRMSYRWCLKPRMMLTGTLASSQQKSRTTSARLFVSNNLPSSSFWLGCGFSCSKRLEWGSLSSLSFGSEGGDVGVESEECGFLPTSTLECNIIWMTVSGFLCPRWRRMDGTIRLYRSISRLICATSSRNSCKFRMGQRKFTRPMKFPNFHSRFT